MGIPLEPAPHLRPKSPRLRIAQESSEHLFTRLQTFSGGALNHGVYLVLQKSNKKKYVQKRIPISRSLMRETELLRSLSHPNVLRYHDAFILPDLVSLYTEYCDLGTLEDLIITYRAVNAQYPNEPKQHLPEPFIWHIFHSLALALQYLHFGIGPSDELIPNPPEDWPIILHRDIKPPNIFLKTPSSYPTPVLADFGCATRYGDLDWNKTTAWVGTLAWQPPELPLHSARGEIYTLGAVILALCRLHLYHPLRPVPYDMQNQRDIWVRMPEARWGLDKYGVGEEYSKRVEGMVRRCLAWDKEDRPLSYELVGRLEEMGLGPVRHVARRQELPAWAFEKR